MTIEFKKSFYGYDLIIEADNVKICEDVESREYQKDENGKVVGNPKRDVCTSAMDMVSKTMEDMVYYRFEEFDSTSLIENLFEKLPELGRARILEKLNKEYKSENLEDNEIVVENGCVFFGVKGGSNV